MDMTNIMYELVNTKTSLTIADRTIETLQKQNRRLNRRVPAPESDYRRTDMAHRYGLQDAERER